MEATKGTILYYSYEANLLLSVCISFLTNIIYSDHRKLVALNKHLLLRDTICLLHIDFVIH